MLRSAMLAATAAFNVGYSASQFGQGSSASSACTMAEVAWMKATYLPSPPPSVYVSH
jgi:hypothetical protein